MIEVKVGNGEVTVALRRLAVSAANPRPVWPAIGEELTGSTKLRFQASTAPDGRKWAPSSSHLLG